MENVPTFVLLSMTPVTETKWQDLLRLRLVCRQWKEESDYLIKKAALASLFEKEADAADIDTLLARGGSIPLTQFLSRLRLVEQTLLFFYERTAVPITTAPTSILGRFFKHELEHLLYEPELVPALRQMLESPLVARHFGMNNTIFRNGFLLQFMRTTLASCTPESLFALQQTIHTGQFYKRHNAHETFNDVRRFPGLLDATMTILARLLPFAQSVQVALNASRIPFYEQPTRIFPMVFLQLIFRLGDDLFKDTQHAYFHPTHFQNIYMKQAKQFKLLLKNCAPLLQAYIRHPRHSDLYYDLEDIIEDWLDFATMLRSPLT